MCGGGGACSRLSIIGERSEGERNGVVSTCGVNPIPFDF